MESRNDPAGAALSLNEPTLSPEGDGRAGAGLLTWTWVALLVLAFAPTCYWLWERWTFSVWYNGHGMFIPFVLAYLLYEDLRLNPGLEQRGSALGFLFVIPALGALALDSAIHTNLLSAAGLVLLLPGLSLLVWGRARSRSLAFAFVIAPFMLPIPAEFVGDVHLFLREITAVGTEHLVRVIGLPVLRQDTLLMIPAGPVLVADACSGFSTLYAAVTLSLILCYLVPSTARRMLLIPGAWLLAIACNVVRVTILVFLIQYQGKEILESAAHELSGMVSFGLTLVLLFAIAGRAALRSEPTPA